MKRHLSSHWFWQKAAPLLSGFSGLLATVFVVGLYQAGAWQPLEAFAYNQLFQVRGEIPWDDRVVVIAIDEASLRTLGRFPWSRQRYTQLLDVLTQADAAVVVFNILFPESSPDDPELATAMLRHGRVVLAQSWDYQMQPLPPNATLQGAAIAVGHIYHKVDADGLTRQIEFQEQQTPALGLAAAQAYSLVREAILLPNAEQPLWLNWTGSVSSIPSYSYKEVLQGQIPAQTFHNKIVLVGVTAAGLDPLRTPFNRNPPVTSVYLHATVINNMLQQNLLTVPSEVEVSVSLLLIGLGVSIFPKDGRWKRWLFMIGIGMGWCLLCVAMFQAGYWLPIASPVLLVFSIALATGIGNYWYDNVLLRYEVNRLWHTYHHGLVLQSSMAHPPLVAQNTAVPDLPPHVCQLAILADQLGRSQSAQVAISRSLSIGLIATDLNERIWFCNPFATAQLQVHPGDILSTYLIPDWVGVEQWQAWITAIRLHRSIPPYEIQQGDHWIELKLEPLFNPFRFAPQSSYPEGMLLLIEDITNRKQVEQTLKQQMQALKELSQLKDDFLSTVSHELRTPMSNIKMAIHMLKLTAPTALPSRYLKILQDECNREISLIDDLLDLQRLENGRHVLSLEAIDLRVWLPQLIEPFYERTQVRQQSLLIHIASDLPLLRTNPSALERIIAELLNNACKYTPPNERIDIKAALIGASLQLTVSNSGVEIAPTEQTRIFEKFYRIPNSDRWKQGGTGLGLALVKKLVEYLEGSIHVYSANRETSFVVQLPLSEGDRLD